MSTLIEEGGTAIDPGAEVKRLQDLVQKLEHQNEVLRSKQKSSNRETNDNVISSTPHNGFTSDETLRTIQHDSDHLRDKMQNCSVDDLDIVDLEKVSEDEESWLYMSPKKSSTKQAISPYKWVRQEFEEPSPEVETVRRSLMYKLNEVTRVHRSPSAGTLNSLNLSLTSPSPPENTSNADGIPSIRKPLFTGSRVDTNTFTRPKKKLVNKIGGSNSGLRAVSPRVPTLGDQPDGQRELTPDQDSNGNRASSDSVDSVDGDVASQPPPAQPRLTDVVDVQVLARMQEESLRQSLNASPKKTFRGSRSALAANINDSENHSAHSSNRSSPGRYEGDVYQTTRRSNNSLASLSSHSNSPPDSPYGSQYLDQRAQVPVAHRRSLPNLSRTLQPAPSHSLHSHPSDTHLNQRGPAASAAGQARLQPPSSPSRLQRPHRGATHGPGTLTPPRTHTTQSGGMKGLGSPGRSLSPQPRRGGGGIPTPRAGTGIPRPGASRLPAPKVKSSIPSPRRSLQPRQQDDSWKDGCF